MTSLARSERNGLADAGAALHQALDNVAVDARDLTVNLPTA
ncbi:hypothetical protein ACIPUC_00540 [Streptomyces sp. LARHCF249]